jgi:Fe-S-cluster containining protein
MADSADFQVVEIEGLPWNAGNIKWYLQHLECEGCGRCCGELSGGVKISFDESKRIAAHLSISNKDFYKTVNKYPDYCVMTQPCRFLKDNRCSIHTVKPNTCLSYPLYYKKESPWITIAACPAGQKLIDKLLVSQGKTN